MGDKGDQYVVSMLHNLGQTDPIFPVKLSRFYPFNCLWANQFTSGTTFSKSRTSPPTFSHVEQVAFPEKVLIILAEKAFCR